jgi:ketosteroid isomerase-like protein
MAVSATVPGPLAPFKESKRTRPSRCALLAAAVATSWVWQASPALAQVAPKVRIITGNGDFLVDLRPPVAHPIAPPAEQQPAAAAQASGASPPAALATTSIPLPARLLAPEAVISPAPATETAVSAAQPAQDTPAMTAAPAVAAADAAATPPASTASSAEAAEAVQAAVRTWAGAWARKDLNAYFASYGQGFTPASGQARQGWEESRRARIVGKSRISVKLSDFAIAVQGSLATARFKQNYSAGALNVSSRKMLELAQEANERWVIVKETTGH